MKVPIKWLNDYLKLPEDLSQWSSRMTSIGHMQDGPAKTVAGDSVYDFEIRQNRSDCLSMLGIARESAVVLETELKNPYKNLEELPTVKNEAKISIENEDLCYRFHTVTIEGIKIGPSPAWLVEKLQAYGIKTINNLVDITNFVMVEIGEPLHAYDRREVKNDEIIIRTAKKGEKVTVLGEKEVALTTEDLVISDPEKILALAGIIGGEHSSIKADTTSIILEDAAYNQAGIRRTSIRHSIRTEASLRHEKFLHPHLADLGLTRAAHLILELCGGEIIDNTDNYPKKPQEISITLTKKNLDRLGGVDIPLSQAQTILEALEFEVSNASDSELTVRPPYFRTDIELEEDIIEEVMRIYGYDNIPETLPNVPPPKDIQSEKFMLEDRVRDVMTAAGYDEQITDPLTKEEKSEHAPVVLENSLNSESTMLRTTLRNNLNKVYTNQKKHHKHEIKVFEVGKIYYKKEGKYIEERMVGILSAGKNITYLHHKGALEVLFERLGLTFKDDVTITRLSDKDAVYFSEFSIENISLKPYLAKPVYTHSQRIVQDLSFFVPTETKVGEILKAIKEMSNFVTQVELVEDRKLEDKRSILVTLYFQSDELQLSNEILEPEKKKIITELENKYKVELRK